MTVLLVSDFDDDCVDREVDLLVGHGFVCLLMG